MGIVRFWAKPKFAQLTAMFLVTQSGDWLRTTALPLRDRSRRPIVAGQGCNPDILDHAEAQAWIEIAHCLLIEINNATGH